MDSGNARFIRDSIVEKCRKMTPVQRVRAFIDHTRVIKQLHAAGQRRRKPDLGATPIIANAIESGNDIRLLARIGKVLDSKRINWGTIGPLSLAYHGVFEVGLGPIALISLKEAELDLNQLAGLFSAEYMTTETRIGKATDPLEFVLRISDSENNHVDLIGGIPQLDSGFFQRTIQDEFNGLMIRFASPEDLIALKLFEGGPQDFEEAKGVLMIQSAAVDKALVLSLCRRFGADMEIRSRKLLGF